MKKNNMVNAVCYRLNNPIIHNKGTQYEKAHYEFLQYISYKSYEDTVAEVEAINNGTQTTLFNGEPTNIHDRVYFVNVQEAFY